mmetsp:Transcript_90029/g.159425  ORF Transcript_90029/g.159425 Transcript_90029/m.159425 type:complete len:279 (+) Transcript_90029:32-868(+)
MSTRWMNLCGDGPSQDAGSMWSARHAETARLLPPPEAESEWEKLLPIKELPDLLPRGEAYYSEPCCGICLVTILSIIFISLTMASCSTETLDEGFCQVVRMLICTFAIIAGFCTLFLLCAGAGEIRRSPSTCYPIPEEVATCLLANPRQPTDGLSNIKSSRDSKTYCVRCFVWRPGEEDYSGKSHHCQICQRCVTGFDHHCGVFGRCIVQANMICFTTVIAMLFCGMLTVAVAFVAAGGSEEGSYSTRRKLTTLWPLLNTTLAPLLVKAPGTTAFVSV